MWPLSRLNQLFVSVLMLNCCSGVLVTEHLHHGLLLLLDLFWNACFYNNFLSFPVLFFLYLQELKRVKCHQVECSPSWSLFSLPSPELSPQLSNSLAPPNTLGLADAHKTELHIPPPPHKPEWSRRSCLSYSEWNTHLTWKEDCMHLQHCKKYVFILD